MKHLETFENFNILEEYMYRRSFDEKERKVRHERTKNYFIKKLIESGEEEKDLEGLDIQELGRKYDRIKKGN